MNLHDLLFGKTSRTQVRCGAFGCNNTITIDLSKPQPDIHICKNCEQRFNEGIVIDVHAHTGRLQGSYNVLDERFIH